MTREEALTALYERGAHLFRFHVERDPQDPHKKSYRFSKGWQAKRHALATVLKAEHVGLIVGSLGLTTCDADVKTAKTPADRQRLGNESCQKVEKWAGECRCIVRTPSKGAHLFYRRREAHAKFTLPKGAVTKEALEVFGDTGFVELYDPVRLAQTLDDLTEFGGEAPKGKVKDDELGGHDRMRRRVGAKVVRGEQVDIEDEVRRLREEGGTERTEEQARVEVERAADGAQEKVDTREWKLHVRNHAELGELWVDVVGTDWRHVPELRLWRRWEERGIPRWGEANDRAVKSISVLSRDHWRTKNGKEDPATAGSWTTTNNGLRFAAAHLGRSLDQWDADPMLLGLDGGEALDLETGEVRAVEREDYLTRHLPVGWPKDGDGQDAIVWIEDKLPSPDVHDWLQKFCGYCLSGQTGEQRMAWLVGDTATGKSTFLGMMAALLGSLHLSLPNDLFHLELFSRGSEKGYALAEGFGRRLVTFSEWPANWKLDEAFFCLITGGDRVAVRQVRQKPFSYRPQFKLLAGANHLPTGGLSPQVLRRLVPVPFDVSHEDTQDAGAIARLTRPAALSRLLAWCLDGWRRYREEGLDDLPVESQRLLRPLRVADEAPGEREEIERRLARVFVEEPYAKVSTKEVHAAVLGDAVSPQSKEGQRIVRGLKCLYDLKKVKGAWFYQGLRRRT